MDKYLITILVIVIMLNTIDIITTEFAIQRYGIEVEMNPIALYTWDVFGRYPMYVVKSIIVPWSILTLCWYGKYKVKFDREKRVVAGGIAIAVCVIAAPAVNNIIQISLSI